MDVEGYLRKRVEIEEEIRKRQERWRTPPVRAEAPSVRIEEEGKPASPRERVVSEPDEPPPPTSVSVKKAGGKPENYEKQPVEAQRVSQDAGIPESFTVQKPARRATDESTKRGWCIAATLPNLPAGMKNTQSM